MSRRRARWRAGLTPPGRRPPAMRRTFWRHFASGSAIASPSRAIGLPGREHDDLRADRHAIVEVDHVGVQHADAAGRDGPADRLRLVGAVDAVERVLAVLEEIHGAGAERIVGAAVHAVGKFASPARRAPASPPAETISAIRASSGSWRRRSRQSLRGRRRCHSGAPCRSARPDRGSAGRDRRRSCPAPRRSDRSRSGGETATGIVSRLTTGTWYGSPVTARRFPTPGRVGERAAEAAEGRARAERQRKRRPRENIVCSAREVPSSADPAHATTLGTPDRSTQAIDPTPNCRIRAIRTRAR